MKKSLDLLRQMIDLEERKNLLAKREAAKKNDFANSTGETQILFHLKTLRDLIEQEMKEIFPK